MRARYVLLMAVVAACGRAEDPMTARAKQFCRTVGAAYEADATLLAQGCSGGCKASLSHDEEDVPDVRAKAAIRDMRGRESAGEIKLCSSQPHASCAFGDYDCLIGLGHALGKELVRD